MPLMEAVEDYMHYLEGIDKSARTVEGYQGDLIMLRKWLEAKYNCPAYLEDITQSDVEEFLLMLKQERHYQASSRKRVMISLRMFYRYGYRKKLCPVDLGAEFEPIKVQQKEREYLTEQEVQDFVAAVEHRLIQVAILIMFYAGLRITECLNLKVKDLEFDRKILKVVAGKGNKDRTIPICDKLGTILLDYLSWREESDYLLATKKSGRLSKVRVSAVIQETVKKLGLKKRVTAHTFRHSFASRLVAGNVNIVSISKLLGHADIKTTSIYTHVNMEQLQDAVSVL